MYINEEIVVHCVPLLMGVDEIYSNPDVDAKEERMQQFRNLLLDAKRMICKEAGLEDIERIFTGITKPKRRSLIVDYHRSQKKRLGIKRRWD